MSRSKSLQLRRHMLVVECALQRSTLTAQTRQLGLSTGWIKSGDGLLDRLKNLPSWVSVAIAAAVIFIPGRAARLARSGLMLWQFWRNIKSGHDTKPEV
jgi:hypothetical protein